MDYRPGYANPNADPAEPFHIEVGVRSTDRRRIEWAPLGDYKEAEFGWHWYNPGDFHFDLKPDHPMIPALRRLRRKAFHVRTYHNGMPYTGRVMAGRIARQLGRENVRFSGFDYKFWLQRWLAWVNPQLPPEIQIALTGKQDIIAGDPDFCFKYYLAKNMIRLHRPVLAALPLRQTYGDLPDLEGIETLDELQAIVDNERATGDGGIFGALLNLFGGLSIMSARFTQGDELFRQERKRLDMGFRMDLWDGTGTSPHVFNTAGLSQLQSVLDATSDNFLNFLNPGNLLGLADPNSWGRADRACYVFDTRSIRDRRKVQWRTDGGQIESYVNDFTHCDATRAIVGGKAPEILNQAIEWAANFAIQMLITLLAPGLGLGFVVGDLFDDIFFAYQQFYDGEAEAEIGIDDAFAEVFADNTAAWSLDSYAIGHTALKDHAGKEALQLTIDSTSGPNHFGADDGTRGRFDVGDMHTFWDRGVVAEQYVTGVTVSDKRDGRKVETPVFGDDERLTGQWDRLVSGIQGFAGATRGIANSL